MTAFLNSVFYSFDASLFTFFGGMESTAMNVVARVFSFFGSWWFGIILAVAAIVMLFFKKTRKYGLVLLLTAGMGVLLSSGLLKPFIARPRPYIGLKDTPLWNSYSQWHAFTGSLTEPEYSFPSGHATFAFAVETGLLLMAHHDDHRKFAYWLIPVPFLIALSRIYLMVHYASDILGGLIVGILAGIAGYFIAAAIETALEKKKKKPARQRSRSEFLSHAARTLPGVNGHADTDSFRIGVNSQMDLDAVRKYKDQEPKPQPSTRGGHMVDFDALAAKKTEEKQNAGSRH